MALVVDAPDDARPARVTLCFTLADVDGCDGRHDGIAFESFADAAHLARADAWLDAAAGQAYLVALGAASDPAASAVVVVDEQVMRGAEWLEQRWRDGGDAFKHMAVAMRAKGLTQAEFSARWRSRAGRVGTTPIPDEARGLAYAQDHPVPRVTGEWPFDAVNEVWFDDLDGLRRRVEWFRENLADGEDDLVRESWFVVAREEVLRS